MALTPEQLTQIVNIQAARLKIQMSTITDPVGLKPTYDDEISSAEEKARSLKSEKLSGKISRNKYIKDMRKIEGELSLLRKDSNKNRMDNIDLWESTNDKIRKAIQRLNEAERSVLNAADLTDIDSDAKGEF